MAQRGVDHVRLSNISTVFTYWLDAEITNSWSSNTTNNQADLTGMVDHFRSVGASVGI